MKGKSPRFPQTRYLTATAVVAAGVSVLTACGGSTKNATPAPSPSPSVSSMPAMPGASAAATTKAPAPVAAGQVSIRNFAFSPAVVTVKAGTTVTWTNEDSDAHTVTDMNGRFTSPTLTTNGTYRHTFTTAGRYAYRCSIHPFMLGTVVVTP